MRLTAMPTLDLFGWAVPVLVVDLSTVVIAVVAALALHWLVFRIAGRIAARTPDSGDDILVAHARRPSRWILVAIALAAVRGVIHLPDGANRLWTLLAGLIVPALILITEMGIHRAVATSLLVITLIGLSGLGSAAVSGREIDWALTGLFVIGGVLGMFSGRVLARYLAGATLQFVFAVAMLATAAFIVVERLVVGA